VEGKVNRFGRAAAAVVMAWCGLAVMAAEPGSGDTPFTDFTGQPRSIESFAGNGKWLVVMIWASDCHVCNREAESYAQFHESHKNRDATLLGVSIDGQAKKADAEDFIRRHDLPFPNLIGEPEAVMLYYMMVSGAQFAGTPTIMVYGPDGTLMAAQAGAVPPEIIEDFMARNSPPAKAG
jgi:peroxiredoxin